jgi:ParB family chromosome partitioning protein
LNRADAFRTILSGAISEQAESASLIALDDIQLRQDQPRRYFDPRAIDQLSRSIQEKGVLQPVLVRKRGNKYELVAGERRYRAAKQAGLEAIPALVADIADEDIAEIALMENLNREDLNPVEETDAILGLLSARLKQPIQDVIVLLRRLYDRGRGRSGNTGVSKEQERIIQAVFEATGRLTVSSFCTHRLPILTLPQDLLYAVRSGRLEYTKAKLLARVPQDDDRSALTVRAIEEGISREGLQKELANLQRQRGARSPHRGVELKAIKDKLTPQRLGKLPTRTRKKIDTLLQKINELLVD